MARSRRSGSFVAPPPRRLLMRTDCLWPPGIIDLHIHYDAQPFWDKLCTPSIWHGVTTVLAGNCGLTLAPLRPEHREAMLATFCCVEDLPLQALSAVLPWTWQSFDEFLKAI